MLRLIQMTSLLFLSLLPIALVLTPAGAAPPAVDNLAHGLLHGDAVAIRAYLRAGGSCNQRMAGQGDASVTPLLAAVWLDRDLAHLLLAEAHDLDMRTSFHGYTAFDIALHLYGESDALTRRLAHDTVRPQGPVDFKQAAWVANGLAVLGSERDQGTTLGLSYLAAVYQGAREPAVSRQDVLKRAELLRGQCRSRTLRDDDRLSAHLAELLLPAIGKAADPRLAHHFSQSMLRRYDLLGQDDAAGAQYRQELLESVYRLATHDPKGAGWVTAQFVGSLFDAAVGEPADTLVKRHPERFAATADLLRAPTVQKQQLLRVWAGALETVPRLRSSADTLSGQFASCESSLYLVQAVAGSRYPKLARELKAVGLASLQIARALLRVGGTAAAVGSNFTVAGNIASAVAILASVANGSLTEPAVRQQVAALASQVDEVRQQVSRLEGMDRQLDRIYLELCSGLRGLSQDMALAREELRGVNVRLALLQCQVFSLAPELRGYIDTAADRSLRRELSHCLDRDCQEGEPLTVAEFTHCLESLRQAATSEAGDALGRGSSLSDTEVTDDSRFAARIVAESLTGNVTLLQAASRRLGQDGGFSRRPLVNPVRWALYADLYVQLAGRYPEYFYRHCSAHGLDQLIEAGRQWQEALHDLTPAFYLRLLENYRDRAEQLRLVIRKKAGWLPRSREQTERDLQNDAAVADALQQLTAARTLLYTFGALGQSQSLASKSQWRQLLGPAVGLPDGQTLRQTHTLLGIGRDGAWHQEPGRKVEVLLREQTGRSEPLPLIETTLDQLRLLRQLHEASQPALPLPEAVKELKRAVQAMASK